MRRNRLPAIAATVLTAVALTPLPARAEFAPTPTATDMAPGLLDAMRRDLNLDASQVAARLRTDATAPVIEKRLRAKLGTDFAGAWIGEGESRLTVAVTDPAVAATVRAEGADPTVVARSAADLDRSVQAMTRNAGNAGLDAVRGWYADIPANRVVVLAAPGAEDIAREFARTSGAGDVTVLTQQERMHPVYDLRGGDQYAVGNVLCSVGFAVTGGFLTAGHCGDVGKSTTGHNGAGQGVVAGSSYPDNDYAWVRTSSAWAPQPRVNGYGGTDVKIAGAQEAPVGSSICRSGRTTGWHCGLVLGRNETHNLPDGPVHAMARTSACAGGGDSGGPFVTGNQAQGMTSAANGNCTTGGQTIFQPVVEPLLAYGLKLTTTGESGRGLINNLSNKCVDVPDADFRDRVRVRLWRCNGTSAQYWNHVNGALQTTGDKCLDVADGATADGTAIQLYGCNGTGAQQFILSSNGNLINPPSGKCAALVSGATGDGTKLALAPCQAATVQTWRRL